MATACTSKAPSAVARDGSVTVTHVFGETRIPAAPKRVVSAGLTEQDDLLAVGVVPVAVTDWYGNQPFGVWPWAQPKLGGAQPVVLSLAEGIQVDQIASLKPDLIVATNAGLDRQSYGKLAAVAPTIAQSGQDAFFESWKDQAGIIGKAVFRDDEMQKLIAATEEKFTAAGTNNPGFAGRTVLLLQGGTVGAAGVVAARRGWRTDFLTAMGLTIPDSLDKYARDTRAVIPRDDMAAVLDSADVLIWTTDSDEEQSAVLADPAVAPLRATSRGHNIFTGKDLAGAIAFASPLSYPVVAEQLPPRLAQILS